MKHRTKAAAFLLAFGLLSVTAVRAADIVDTAISAGQFNTLATALKAAGLVDALKAPGPFTVFAPTDEAFAKLPAGTLEDLLKPENREKLRAILTYHVVSGRVPSKEVVKLRSAKTLNGQSVRIRTREGKVQVDDANVVKADIEAANGIIHVIDKVILPKQ
ncbi:MAG: fasciclin domain-containing protein [Bryobacterales bacterium]|nr:fasciclin domain-containing protein [Bryobacteraceae bacterium]MDW8130946.1 fasciclin domain-containing protein [Bryobacterales bacterium]